MATPDDKKKSQPQSPQASPSEIDPFGGAAPEGWNETGSKNIYKPDHFVDHSEGKNQYCFRLGPDGKEIPTAPLIQGYPVSVEERPSEYQGQEFYYTIDIQLTRDSHVKERDGKTLRRVPKGSCISINMTAALKRVGMLARLPDQSVEVFMRPRQKVDIGEGQSVWEWTISENPKPVPRVRVGGDVLGLGPSEEPKSLGQGN